MPPAQASSSHSHLMRTTRRGRPFAKDTFDLFSTLMISLPMGNRRSFFKTYPNAFTVDEAAANLASLKFSQSSRTADPKDPTRIVTTTTTTTFSMSRDMAKGICQHFMDARLIENAADLSSTAFKERGVYMATPKGLHILERFITKNGISAENITRLFFEQIVCLKLLHIERRSADDDIIVTKSVIQVLWRRFIGKEPNVTSLSDDDIITQINSRWFNPFSVPAGGEVIDRASGQLLRKTSASGDSKGSGVLDDYTFGALSAIDWLCEYSTCIGPDEAGEVAAHFVRYGYISLVSDKGKPKDSDMITTVKAGGAGGSAGAMMQEADFRATPKAIYRVTKEGMIAARWELPGLNINPTVNPVANVSKQNLHEPGRSARLSMLEDKANLEQSEHTKESHAARLRQILDEPAIRSLFREYLRANYCEENLSFWLDLEDFKTKFHTTSSAQLGGNNAQGRKTGQMAMEKHQQELIASAFVIYNTYLAPASPAELNVDHQIRAEIISHMNQLSIDKDSGNGTIEPGVGNTLHASQLQITLRLYERIQTYIYRLMATDSVPKFCKTQRFITTMQTIAEYTQKQWDNEAADHKLVLKGMEEDEPTRAYITISHAANEKAVAQELMKDDNGKTAVARKS